MNTQPSLRNKAARIMGKLLSVSFLVWGLGVAFTPALAAVTVDQQPLITQKPLAPNIVLMLDDSGSMAWDFMPDAKYLSGMYRVTNTENGYTFSDYLVGLDSLRNNAANGVYYDPTVTYKVPVQADGTNYPSPVDIGSAFLNGFLDRSTANQVDVTQYASDSFCSYNGYNSTQSGYWYCPDSLYHFFKYYTNYGVDTTTTSTYAPTRSCNWGDTLMTSGTYSGQCRHVKSNGTVTYYSPSLTCPEGGSYDSSAGVCSKSVTTTAYTKLFTYTTKNADGSFARHYIGKEGSCAAASLDSSTCSDTAADRLNVAIWFSYYRTRMLMAKSGLMSALSGVDKTYRMGFGSINGNKDDELPDSKVKYGSNDNYIAPVEAFGDGSSGTQKARFWTWLNDLTSNNGTPLRRSLDAVGKYYQSAQPWQTSSSDTTELACRQAYTILTTDGFWNGNDPASVDDQDSAAGDTIQGPNDVSYAYSPTLPFSDGQATTKTYSHYLNKASKCKAKYEDLTGSADGYQSSYYSGSICTFTYTDTSGSIFSDTLADVAMKYWKNDLRPTLVNEVPTTHTGEDPAFWQHMVTFTMGLGFTPQYADGTEIPMEQVQKWANGDSAQAISNFAWPEPSSDSINNIADLAHAGINGHGGFFKASDPTTFASGLEGALKRAESRVGTGASLAANSTSLKTGTVAYQANYFTSEWKGDLKAYAVDATTGAIASLPTWTAATELPKAASRNIHTYNPASGADVEFKLVASLSDAQQTALSSVETVRQGVLDYLRGDSSKEQSKDKGIYRTRATPLGDIVDSQPVYVADPDANLFNGQTFAGTDTYATFADDHASRTAKIYVAANDGMLHMFDAATGAETYAYVPGAVITSGLADLADPDYGKVAVPHQFYNDGELTVADVYDSVNAAWRTVLVGTTGRGLAKAVYALDVTDPTNVKLLWERSAGDGKGNSGYIGQMVGKPVIAQTSDGDWSVFIGNGYNSANGTAALLQFDIDDGTLSVHATDDTTDNGLAAPGLWMADKTSGFSSIAYAGDLFGRVWSFALNTSSTAPASASTSGSATTTTTTSNKDSVGTNIFVAKDSAGNVQPITAGMLVGKDPAAASNVWVFFGTGKYLDQSKDLVTTDVSTKKTQTLYGLIVSSSTSGLAVTSDSTRTDDLVQRQIIAETAAVEAAPADPVAGTPAVEAVSPARAITQADDATPIGDKSGWYIDLLSPKVNADDPTKTDYVAEGERVVTPNLFQGNQLIATTRIPEGGDACNPSGRGWIMSIDPFTGLAPESSFFDLNGDGVIDGKDSITAGGKTYPASGIGFSSLPNNPIFVGSVMLVSFDNGTTSSVKTSGSGGKTERVSWRELINQ